MENKISIGEGIVAENNTELYKPFYVFCIPHAVSLFYSKRATPATLREGVRRAIDHAEGSSDHIFQFNKDGQRQT